MVTKNSVIDAYIAQAAPFAQPVLRRLRATVHRACPACEEAVKWRFPHFMYDGKMLCSMAAFKAHCAFGFWKADLLGDAEGVLEKADRTAMGQLGRITSVKDLPSEKALGALIKEAMRLIDEDVKVPCVPTKKPPVVVPTYLTAALRRNKQAAATFKAFPPSHQREYVDWLTEAKTEATREKRLLTALEWLAEGKSRHWKYQS